jgi:hypothetical protein
MTFYIGFAGTTNNLAFYLSVKNLRKYREDDPSVNSVKLLINNAPIKKYNKGLGWKRFWVTWIMMTWNALMASAGFNIEHKISMVKTF